MRIRHPIRQSTVRQPLRQFVRQPLRQFTRQQQTMRPHRMFDQKTIHRRFAWQRSQIVRRVKLQKIAVAPVRQRVRSQSQRMHGFVSDPVQTSQRITAPQVVNKYVVPIRNIEPKRTHLLTPNRSSIDLFDKTYRSKLLQLHTVIHQKSPDIPFPEELGQMFAISIRPTRFENLRARLGPWAKHVQLWPGTVGATLDKDKMIRDGILVKKTYDLKRGEIGCYDSHIRLWRHIAEKNIPRALILEDDADLKCNPTTVYRIQQLFRDLARFNIQYDVLYFGHNDVPWNQPLGFIPDTEIGIPRDCQGLFTYFVTLEGAKKLVQIALPMSVPIDIHVTNNKAFVKQYTMEPRLNSVVQVESSDTNNVL